MNFISSYRIWFMRFEVADAVDAAMMTLAQLDLCGYFQLFSYSAPSSASFAA
jgi:hypothetical protein